MSEENSNKPELTIDVPSPSKESIELNTSLSPISEETPHPTTPVEEVKIEEVKVEETKKEVAFQDQQDPESCKQDKVIKEAIVNLFKDKDRLKVATSLDIISMIMEIAETIFLHDAIAKKNLVLSIVERVAKGLDGIEGTSDDIISQETMNSIRVLLQNNLVEGIINGLIKASKQLFNFNKKKKWCCF